MKDRKSSRIVLLCCWGLTNLYVAEALVDATLMLAVRWVEVVLDTVVAASWEFFCNVGPFVAKLFVQIKNLLLFCFVNWGFVDVGIKVIMPSTQTQFKELGSDRNDLTCCSNVPFTALLAGASANFEFVFQFIGNKCPLFCAVLFYKLNYCIVFLLILSKTS